MNNACHRSRAVFVFHDRGELLDRVELALRRSPPPDLQVGALDISAERGSARWRGRPLRLSAREFGILSMLARHAGEVLTRDDLFNGLWDGEFAGEARLIDRYIALLRQKLDDGAGLIETVRGVGYRLLRTQTDPMCKSGPGG